MAIDKRWGEIYSEASKEFVTGFEPIIAADKPVALDAEQLDNKVFDGEAGDSDRDLYRGVDS